MGNETQHSHLGFSVGTSVDYERSLFSSLVRRTNEKTLLAKILKSFRLDYEYEF